MTCVGVTMMSVWPSGAERAASSPATLPPAPGRLSTTKVCPNTSASFCVRTRATLSVPPPGARPTKTLTGRCG